MPVLLIITSIMKDFSSKDGTSLSMHAKVMRVGGGGGGGGTATKCQPSKVWHVLLRQCHAYSILTVP